MRFLIDANLSPGVADRLRGAGHDAVAVRELGLQDADDERILDVALEDDRVVVSHDTDFGTLLAVRHVSKPSFILIRSADPLTTTQIVELLLNNLKRHDRRPRRRRDRHLRPRTPPITPPTARVAGGSGHAAGALSPSIADTATGARSVRFVRTVRRRGASASGLEDSSSACHPRSKVRPDPSTGRARAP